MTTPTFVFAWRAVRQVAFARRVQLGPVHTDLVPLMLADLAGKRP